MSTRPDDRWLRKSARDGALAAGLFLLINVFLLRLDRGIAWPEAFALAAVLLVATIGWAALDQRNRRRTG